MASTKPQYVPTSEEMKDAVAVALKDVEIDKKPTKKELQWILESENPTWKIPERRIGKFLKRELKKKGMAPPESSPQGDDDDDESVVSTTSRARELARSTVESLKKVVTTPGKSLFSFRKKKQQKEAAAANSNMPPMLISTPNLNQEYATPQKRSAPRVVEEPVVEEVDEKKVIGLNKYEDDNDGNKEGQMCADTCIIL